MTVPPPPRPITLAKVATVLAVAFMVAFGLCTVNLVSGGFGSTMVMTIMGRVSLGAEAICLVGLLVVGAIAFIRSLRGRS